MTEKHEPTKKIRGQVELLASFGVPQAEIANYLDIDAKTLRLHYRKELDKAMMTAHANVSRFLYKMASGMALKEGATHRECTTAAIFYAKTRMGWRETDAPDAPPDDAIVINYFKGIPPDAA